jgi:hypothetical protein
MKLYEFVDKLYAMGGIEQEGKKKSRILNEDINSDERLNQIKKELSTLDSSYEIIEDKDWGWIYNDDWIYGDITYVQITYPISEYGMKAFPQNFNVQVVDGDPINSLDRGFDNLSDAINYAPIQFKKYFLDESLNEDIQMTESLKPEDLVPGEVYNHKTIPYMDKDEAEEYPEEFEEVKAALVLRKGVYCVPRRYELKYVGTENQTPGWNSALIFDVMGTELSFNTDVLNYIEF